MKELKPFDLEKAKAGEPICMKSGEIVNFIGMDSGFPVVNRYGGFYRMLDLDLYMAPKKRTVYVNLKHDGHGWWSKTENEAKDLASVGNFAAIAVPVEIEE